jgi:DtxR family Mn-dependent transcriptional regulator
MSEAREDYLEVILRLGEDGRPVRVTDIAARLGIAKASVTQALVGLKSDGMVRQEPYGQVYLTARGRAQAAMVEKRHRVLRAFLAGVLGVPSSVAETEACRLEHAIGQDTLARLVTFLEKDARGKVNP